MSLSEVEERLEALYGVVDWRSARGLVHVAAISGRSQNILALGEQAPRSETDRFVLGVARARADLILTTGAILRSEPTLRHDYAETRTLDHGLAEWRRERLGRSGPPALVILSGRADFDPDHPALAACGRGLLWTSEESRARLGPSLGTIDVVAGAGDATRSAGRPLDRLVAHAFERLGGDTLCVEAGPTVTRELYSRENEPVSSGPWLPARVDELLLSRFEGAIAPEVEGPPFPSDAEIDAEVGASLSDHRVEEPSGGWRFSRYRR